MRMQLARTTPGPDRVEGLLRWLPIQRRATVSSAGDPFEREADDVAAKILRMDNPVPNRGGAAAESDTQSDAGAAVRAAGRDGAPLPREVRSYFEPRFRHDFSRVRVHADGDAASGARAVQARAFTLGEQIVFGSGEYNPATTEGKRLLAHELAHVVQQGGNPLHSASALIQRQACGSPHDKALVERAKKRLAVLEPQLAALQNRRMAVEAERLRLPSDRATLNRSGSELDPKGREAFEKNQMANLNRSPVSLTVTDDAIVFQVRFQVFFNDPGMRNRFGSLTSAARAGIDLVWNQTLKQGVFSGRKFTVMPSFSLIDSLAQRTQKAWLISVRKSDQGKVAHPGCTLSQPAAGVPTSVTDALCDGGVMSIPPSHVPLAGILGHEMLHLFGLADWYMQFTDIDPKGKQTVTLLPSRETRGRKDPAGGEDGTILSEDLGFVLEEFGAYDKEQDRSRPSLDLVEREVMRLREIVDAGCDPHSLLPIRKDFMDKVIKSAEDL